MLENLPYIEFNCLKELPEVSAIYFVKKQKEYLYIGKTKNLAQRWLAHHRYQELKALNADKLEWLVIKDLNIIDDLEQKFIEQLKPFLNGCKIKPTNTDLSQQDLDIDKPKMVRFQIYLCQADATMLRELAILLAPESESTILKMCLVTNTSLFNMYMNVLERKKIIKSMEE